MVDQVLTANTMMMTMTMYTTEMTTDNIVMTFTMMKSMMNSRFFMKDLLHTNLILSIVGEKLFSINPNLISNSFAFIKNYLIEDVNYLTFFTSVGSVREIQSKSLIFKKINHKLFLNNKVGIIVSKKNRLKKYTEEFIDLIKKEFQNSEAADCKKKLN